MSETLSPIRGKVARILTTRELALNVGSSDGVEVGMIFDVLDPKGERITDPDTGEVLGSIARPKTRVRVTVVQENLSIASTYRIKRRNVGGDNPAAIHPGVFSAFLLGPRYVDAPETLKTQEMTWEDLDESESFVKTGDPVVEVLDEVDSVQG